MAGTDDRRTCSDCAAEIAARTEVAEAARLAAVPSMGVAELAEYFHDRLNDDCGYKLRPVTGTMLADALRAADVATVRMTFKNRIGMRTTRNVGWQIHQNYTHNDAREPGRRVFLAPDGSVGVFSGSDWPLRESDWRPYRIFSSSHLWPVQVLQGIRSTMFLMRRFGETKAGLKVSQNLGGPEY